MNGRVTDIQRFSLHDGSGIRTTVFLHGCNMRCLWCHNPETLTEKNTPLFYPRKCIGCGHCYTACPTGARAKDFDPALCTACGACAESCYPEAIHMAYREMSAEDVMREAVQDSLYYALSGGGVTFSGGEALCQRDFVSCLADLCREKGIPCAVETNLYHPFELIRPVLEKMSLVMADIKLFDDAEHRKWTGVSNAPILENAKKLTGLGIPVIFRTPLIPGATDDIENLRRIASFVSALPNVQRYEILNFNPLGADKYSALRRENPFRDARPFPADRLDRIRQALSGCGVPVRID